MGTLAAVAGNSAIYVSPSLGLAPFLLYVPSYGEGLEMTAAPETKPDVKDLRDKAKQDALIQRKIYKALQNQVILARRTARDTRLTLLLVGILLILTILALVQANFG
jgi:hypothetical protein